MEVLDLACGHGRIANALAARGCRVTGLDVTPLFLDRARHDAAARGVAVTYVDGDMRDLPCSEPSTRVINWFTSFGYFDDVGHRRVLTEVARVLKPGGRFALEIGHRDRVIRQFQPASMDERDGNLLGTLGDHWSPSPGEDLVVRPLPQGLHAHFRAARLPVRMAPSGQEKARASEPMG